MTTELTQTQISYNAFKWLKEYRSEAATYHIANSIKMPGKTQKVRRELVKLEKKGLVISRKESSGYIYWKAK